MKILQSLNERQREAVLQTDGPVLIIAGAGSGKTKVLVHRIAYLIEQGTHPDQILAVTFTNKAAKEMQERARELIAQGKSHVEKPWIGTFHALGVYILRREGSALAIPKNFTILDEDDVLSLIKSILKEKNLNPKQFQPSRMRHFISRLKNEFVVPGNYDLVEETYPQELLQTYEAYAAELQKMGSLDFDDLLVKTS
jgi:DNA helicase II / ATP-dependent DNA helicase PcrA